MPRPISHFTVLLEYSVADSNGCQSGTLVKRFNEARDWQGELDRLNVRGVHVLPCNSGFLTCSRYSTKLFVICSLCLHTMPFKRAVWCESTRHTLSQSNPKLVRSKPVLITVDIKRTRVHMQIRVVLYAQFARGLRCSGLPAYVGR